MKHLKLLFLSLLLAAAVHAEEQRALVIRSSYSSSSTNPKELSELSVLLLQGWTVASTTPGSGNDSMSSYWLVILKK